MQKKNTNESKTKSKPTTTNSSHTKFTGQEICDIIKTCGESGVVNFECDGLCLSFQARTEEVKVDHNIYPSGPMAEIPKILDEQDLIKTDEINAKDEELAELRLQDPYKFETLMAEAELTQEG